VCGSQCIERSCCSSEAVHGARVAACCRQHVGHGHSLGGRDRQRRVWNHGRVAHLATERQRGHTAHACAMHRECVHRRQSLSERKAPTYNGASVSSNKRSRGKMATTSRTFCAVLKVTTPVMPMKRLLQPLRRRCAMSTEDVKQCTWMRWSVGRWRRISSSVSSSASLHAIRASALE